MTRRRLLIVSYFFPPLAGGGVHRVLGFVRHLPQAGWACTVVCAGPEDSWVIDPTLERVVPADTEVVRVSAGSALGAWLKWTRRGRGRRPSGVFAGLRRATDWWPLPDAYRGWAGRAERAAARLIQRGGFDAVLSSSPPDSTHFAALPIQRRFGIPWVADFRDPWIALYFRRPPTAWHRARQIALERQVIESATLVLAASRTHAEELERMLGPRGAGRVLHLPNGYEPEPTRVAPESAAAPGEAKAPTGTFRIVYTGVMAHMPDVEILFEALHELFARRPEARRRVRVQLAGPYESGYADRAVALSLTGIVTFSGPVSHAEARTLQRTADLLVLWMPRGFPSMVPGKLYEYVDAQRPIVAVIDSNGEAASLVRAAGGAVTPVGDRMALAAELERRYLAWCDGEVPSVPRAAFLDGHARPALAARLATALDRIVEARA